MAEVKKIKKILIANRGEIACRVMRTANKLGIKTVAVYSEADENALHVRTADESICIGAAPAAESYLDMQKLLSAIQETGADAVHPGYGFLSENATFAQLLADNGIIWVGPPAKSIEAMGHKAEAKKLMMQANVPLVPGYEGESQNPEDLFKQAGKVGVPLMIKASSGGGGKGIRKVEDLNDFKEALESVKRESAKAFGDDHVLLEKFVTNPRHVEVQVFADNHGKAITLFERDCSLQRRNQKVIEEAPAPGITEQTRQALSEASKNAALKIGYQGAGTVEFLMDDAQNVYFMEMNTRLQVEHPVTECITDLDLVQLQLEIAEGKAIALSQDELSIDGHAIEARLYAENPDHDFRPSIGHLDFVDFPELEGLRYDTGVETGDEISPWYDPMIAKVIAHGTDRADAIAKLKTALEELCVSGIEHNRGWLQRVISLESFNDVTMTTDTLAQSESHLSRVPDLQLIAESASYADKELNQAKHDNPLATLGLRTLADSAHARKWQIGDEAILAEPKDHDQVIATYIEDQNAWHIQLPEYEVLAERFKPITEEVIEMAEGDLPLKAPMHGKIVKVDASLGQSVQQGDTLVVVEAMKMEHRITALVDGTITQMNDIQVDQQVDEGQILGILSTLEQSDV
jgi:3-methylcrotonyl-CoA carboxylase alpha subunit